MKPADARPTLLRWLKWPVICLLCLAWVIPALTGWLFGGIGAGGTFVADRIVGLIDDFGDLD